jgi:hypothetical protein
MELATTKEITTMIAGFRRCDMREFDTRESDAREFDAREFALWRAIVAS